MKVLICVTFFFAIISSTDSFPKPFKIAKEILQPLSSLQFVLTVKSHNNPVVLKALQSLVQFLWELECPVILRRDTNQITRNLIKSRHRSSAFVQLMLTQESEDSIFLHNPLSLFDWDLSQFNVNVGIYRDVFLVFYVQAPRSRLELAIVGIHCLTPSNYHMFRVSPDAEFINVAMRIEALESTVYWVICHLPFCSQFSKI